MKIPAEVAQTALVVLRTAEALAETLIQHATTCPKCVIHADQVTCTYCPDGVVIDKRYQIARKEAEPFLQVYRSRAEIGTA